MIKLNFEPIAAEYTSQHKKMYAPYVKGKKAISALYTNEDKSPWTIEQFKESPFVIRVENPDNLPLCDIRELKALQGNLKELHEHRFYKLKASMMMFNFKFPFYRWIEPKTKIEWIIDGHGRHVLLHHLKPVDLKGEPIYHFPCITIEAKDKKEAKQLLLAATSQIQTITQTGFEEYVYDLDLIIVNNTTAFDGVYSITTDNKQEDPKSKKITGPLDTKHQCPSCGYQF